MDLSVISIIAQFIVVLVLIFIGAKLGGVGMGIAGMLGVFILVYGFGLAPGKIPVDVMLIIVSVISAAAALQASGGMDYLVGVAAKLLREYPHHITYLGPVVCWLFCLMAGTAHTSYSMLPIISEIARKNKVRPERPLSVSVIAASLGITGSPVSAATAAIISTDLLGGMGIELKDILIICVPASLIAILISAFIQNRVGKELDDDTVYQQRLKAGQIEDTAETDLLAEMSPEKRKRARNSVFAFLFGVTLVVLFGSAPSLRPATVTMSETIEMVMLSTAGLILLVGRVKIGTVSKGNIFEAGMNAMISIFGVAWMGDTYFSSHLELFSNGIFGLVNQAPILFAVALFFMSIMLFSQAATVRTLYPLGVTLGINPLLMVAMFPACNGYFFLPNYPTEVAAINLDKTGTTTAGKYVLDHSFQLSGFITTFVSIGVACAVVWLLY